MVMQVAHGSYVPKLADVLLNVMCSGGYVTGHGGDRRI